MEVILMPRLGMTMETGEIVSWLKGENEQVQAGEAILEVLTDKSNSEVESPVDGTIARVFAQEGDEVAVGKPLAVIAAVGETISEAEIAAVLAKSAAKEEAAPQPETAPPPPLQEIPRATETPVAASATTFRATPRVRKIAQELGVDLAAITPSQPDGTITEEDVRRFAQS